jgi:hypothetical protein
MHLAIEAYRADAWPIQVIIVMAHTRPQGCFQIFHALLFALQSRVKSTDTTTRGLSTSRIEDRDVAHILSDQPNDEGAPRRSMSKLQSLGGATWLAAENSCGHPATASLFSVVESTLKRP